MIVLSRTLLKKNSIDIAKIYPLAGNNIGNIGLLLGQIGYIIMKQHSALMNLM